jgi:VanZ family protein
MVKRNILSILTALLILYLSLSNSENFEGAPFWNIPNIDKIVHFIMYFFFMSVIVFENRNTIKYRSSLLLIGFIPVVYGALMELFQLLFTNTRFASFIDFLYNTAGILFSVLLCLALKPVRGILFK